VEQELIDLVREMHKEAASKGCMQVANARAGRRPMRVATLLSKEKDGTLYKQTEAIKKASRANPLVLPGSLEFRRPKGPVSADKTPVAKSTEPDVATDELDQRNFTALGDLEKGGEAAITYSEAEEALKKLRKLEKEKVTKEDVGRAAATGAIVGPASALVGGLASGAVPKAFMGEAGKGGYLHAPRAGSWEKLKGVASGSKNVGRALTAAALGAGTVSAIGPLVARALAKRSQEAKLRDYIENRPSTKLRQDITKMTGL